MEKTTDWEPGRPGEYRTILTALFIGGGASGLWSDMSGIGTSCILTAISFYLHGCTRRNDAAGAPSPEQVLLAGRLMVAALVLIHEGLVAQACNGIVFLFLLSAGYLDTPRTNFRHYFSASLEEYALALARCCTALYAGIFGFPGALLQVLRSFWKPGEPVSEPLQRVTIAGRMHTTGIIAAFTIPFLVVFYLVDGDLTRFCQNLFAICGDSGFQPASLGKVIFGLCAGGMVYGLGRATEQCTDGTAASEQVAVSYEDSLVPGPQEQQRKNDFLLGLSSAALVVLVFSMWQVLFLLNRWQALTSDQLSTQTQEGFLELGLGAVLAIPAILVAANRIAREEPEVILLFCAASRTLLLGTFALIGAAVFRLWWYVAVFGLTEARLLGVFFLATLVYALVLLYTTVVTRRGGWVGAQRAFGGRLVAGVLCVFLLVPWCNPGASIAWWNTTHITSQGVDTEYLMQLSPDALTPLIDAVCHQSQLPPGTRFSLARSIIAWEKATKTQPFWEFTASTIIARISVRRHYLTLHAVAFPPRKRDTRSVRGHAVGKEMK